MKSQVNVLFDRWLDLMEYAYDTLDFYEFVELEDKIRKEISHRRKNNKESGDV